MAIFVHKLILLESNGHDDQYSRGFTPNLTNATRERFNNAVDGGQGLSYGTLSGVASDLIVPVAQPEGVATMPSGWAHPRYYFLMVVSRRNENAVGLVSGESYEVISGYTSHRMEGLYNFTSGANVSVDPTLIFYPNNITRAMLVPVSRRDGTVESDLHLQEVIQLTPKQFNSHQMAMQNTAALPKFGVNPLGSLHYYETRGEQPPVQQNMAYQPGDNTHLITPGDITRQALMIQMTGGYPYQMTTHQSLGAEPMQHYRVDADPTSFLVRAVTAKMYADANAMDATAYNQPFASEVCHLPPGVEPSVDANTIFRDLTTYTQYSETGGVTFNELLMKVPTLNDVTELVLTGQQQHMAFEKPLPADMGITRDVSEPMNGASMDIIAVVKMVGMLTTIFTRLGVVRATLVMTNLNVAMDGLPYNVSVLEYTHILTMVTGSCGNFSRMIDSAICEIRQYLMPALTNNNQIPVNCRIHFRMYGDTTVQMSYDRGRLRDYIIPLWSDGCISPTVTYDPLRAGDMGAALNVLTSGLHAITKPY